ASVEYLLKGPGRAIWQSLFRRHPMADRFPRAFWRSSRNCWFVQLGKRQVTLHPERDEAFRMYHALMSRVEHEGPKIIGSDPPVVEVLDTFLEWAEANGSPRTFAWRKENLEVFAKSVSPDSAL